MSVAASTSVTYAVTGMTCAACARRVEGAIASLPGVTGVRVDAATNSAQVQGNVTRDRLAATVAAAGYGLSTGDQTQAEQPAAWPAILGLALTAPLLAPMLGLPLHLPWWLQGTLAAVVVFAIGAPFLQRAVALARRGETSMDTLIALGAILGLVLGVWEATRGAAHLPFEISASLVAFLRFGRYIEARAKHRATGSLADLLRLSPDQAERLGEDGQTSTVAVASLHPGERILVKPGGRVPVDGLVVEGAADCDESALSGEPLPVAKTAGASVMAGSLVHGGKLVVEVVAAGHDTWLAALADQVQAAQRSRPAAQILADRIAAVFVPAVLLISGLTFAAWWALSGDPGLAARIAITTLVVACPCALGLATPIAMATGLASAARQGVLVRDQSTLDSLARATDLVLDKTGTLTAGTPAITDVLLTGDAELDAQQARAIAAALERDSEHPIARAFAADDLGQTVQDFQAIPGQGVAGSIDGSRWRLGRIGWAGSLSETPADGALVLLGRESADGIQAVAGFVITDPLRAETTAIVSAWASDGLRLHLASGDRQANVDAITAELPLTSRRGDLSPQAKRAMVDDLRARGSVVAFAGDGINDAAALAAADAGVSLHGLDAAAVAAPLNLKRPGLQALADLITLSRRIRRIVIQNLGWAFGYNILLIPLAALGLLEHLGGPVLAGAAMALSSLTVVLNALRLRAD